MCVSNNNAGPEANSRPEMLNGRTVLCYTDCMIESGEPHRHGILRHVSAAIGWAWTVCGWFGVPQLIASLLIAVTTWGYGYLRREPIVTLSMGAVSLFVALAYLTRLPTVARWMTSKPNAAIWRHADRLALWQAACLLDDVNPPVAMGSWLPSGDSNAYYAVLALAVGTGELKRVRMAGQQGSTNPSVPEQINFGTFVTRESLQEFAAKRRFKARFLE